MVKWDAWKETMEKKGKHRHGSNDKAMNMNCSNQKANSALKIKWEITKVTNRQKTMRTNEVSISGL